MKNWRFSTTIISLYFEKDTRNGHSYNGSEHELVGDL